MNKNISYKDLDHILKQLKQANDNGEEGIRTTAIQYLNSKTSPEDKNIIINKLEKDNVIKLTMSNGVNPFIAIYSITFEGLLLLQEDGYVGRLNKQKWTKRRDAIISIVVALGTILATIFSIYSISHKEPKTNNDKVIQSVLKRDSILISSFKNKTTDINR